MKIIDKKRLKSKSFIKGALAELEIISSVIILKYF